MEWIGKQVHYWMFDFWKQHGDPRSDGYFMIDNGLYEPVAILVVYFLFVTQVGPRLMHHRKPYNLKWTLLGYNCIMMLMNFYFFVETLWNYNYGLDIFDFDYPRPDDYRPITLKKVATCHFYLMSKFVDLIETVFFVLRKKNKQISKLHLYHHISVPFLGWIVLRVIPSNQPVVCIL